MFVCIRFVKLLHCPHHRPKAMRMMHDWQCYMHSKWYMVSRLSSGMDERVGCKVNAVERTNFWFLDNHDNHNTSSRGIAGTMCL